MYKILVKLVSDWVNGKKCESAYSSSIIMDGNMVTLNKKKDKLSDNFISSGHIKKILYNGN